jgi:hypothetical protein
MAELETDRQLLRDYAERGSESAFQELVNRHLDLVFATEFRGEQGTDLTANYGFANLAKIFVLIIRS